MQSTPLSSKTNDVDDKSENVDSQPSAEVVASRIRDRAEHLGITRSNLLTISEVRKQTFAGYWNGERVPPAHVLLRLAEILDVSPRWLLFGDEASAGALRDRRQAYRGPPAADESDAALDLVAVHEIDLAYGMGGTYSDIGVETQVLHFPRTWLESITRTSPTLLTFAKGKGDSMQPTVQDGDIVLIDRSVRTIREQDAIWAMTIGDIAMIKRVRVKGERVSILSDNDRIPPDEAHHEEINVVGRVVFIGRRI